MLKKIALFAASTVLVLVVLAGLMGAALFFQTRFEDRQKTASQRLQFGDSETKLLDLVGRPTYKTDGTRWVEPKYAKSENQLTPGCVSEYWYESGIPLMPSKWAYCFDASGKLLKSAHWASW